MVDSKDVAVFGHQRVNQLQHWVALALLLVLPQGVRVGEQRLEDGDHAAVVPLAQLFQRQQGLCA
jgi:hypothetical protein